MKWVFRIYRAMFSSWLGYHCRFYPTCSVYAEQAIEKHGIGKGLWLTIWRISKCQPFHPGGYDPVCEKPRG